MHGKKIVLECRYIGFINNRLHYKCKECNDESYKSIIELIEKFPNTHRFCHGDLNKFVLLLKKSVYPYEYIDNWEKFNETSLPDKEAFYSELNKEGITDENYAHAQKVWKVSEIKHFGEYHDLYVQCDTLLLADVFETLEINVSKYITFILLFSYQHQDQHDKYV